ncbi:phage antirepressor KilAC domain-containing protein [Salinicoccus sp. HZC-1]|uniref:phage antirepressor KilAC domain-containing protein n=1 Tax=Salinicoccus sp. HZC-1 TaxID=3385497 RepID=UPI00398B9382
MEQLQVENKQTLIPVTENEEGQLFISARELHEFLESSERFSKWFIRMISYGFVENEDFTSGQKSTVVNNGALRKLEDFNLTVDMAKEISMIQRNEKGKQARQYFLQIEKAWNSPDMIMKRALQIADKKVMKLEEKIQLDKPKVLFADAVDSSTSSILIGELAKLISQNGYDIGQNRLFEWLRKNGFLIRKKGESFNLPTQRSMDMGLMDIKKRTINNADGSIRTTRTTKVTGKGQQYFINKFLGE